MKGILLGVLLLILLGVGGLVYRNAVEHPLQEIACPADAKVCPDGTSVGRTGPSCVFPTCSPPNISLADANILFALPEGFAPSSSLDQDALATYELSSTTLGTARIVVHRYAVNASSTPLSVILQTAVGDPSGLPVSATAFTSLELGGRRFTVVSIERFEGVIDTAYYLARTADVLRFDAIDFGTDWTNPSLILSTLPAHSALEKMLTTIQGG